MTAFRALAALLGSAVLCTPALGYERSTSCPGVGEPTDQCIGLSWNTGCVVYHVNDGDFPTPEAPEDVMEAIRRSFATWDAVECSAMSLVEGGTSDEDQVGYDTCDPEGNVNLVRFRPVDWPHDTRTIALTTVTWRDSDGQIVDADIELNSEVYTFTTGEPTLQTIDVQNTVTHEVGHLLGFEHSGVDGATMGYASRPGETAKRDLDADDILGLCDVYPESLDLPCDSSSVGFVPASPDEYGTCDPGGCGCAATPAPGGSGLWAGVLGLAGLLGRRRERSPALP